MASLNRVQLIGRLGKDPEARRLQNGGLVVNFSVATGEYWTDKRSGEKKERTDWHNVVVWNEKTAEWAEENLYKGDLVLVEGKLQTRKWEDQKGDTRYATEVVVQPFHGTVQKLGEPKGESGNGASRSSRNSDEDSNRPMNNAYSRSGRKDDLDDDIPFEGSEPSRGNGSSRPDASTWNQSSEDCPF